MTDPMTTARGEAVQAIASAIVTAAGRELAIHGNDPHSNILVVAAFAFACDGINEVIPNFTQMLHMQLGAKLGRG